MNQAFNILILGASYGSLLGSKLLMAGHHVTLVCRRETAALINAEGTRVRMPLKGRAQAVVVDSRALPGKLHASAPDDVDPHHFDLVCLAMQEPQYSAPGVRELLMSVAKARVPCMSVMNMPPLPFLARISPGLAEECRPCYKQAEIWDEFEPGLVTLCSPDPQAFRPPGEPANVLQVGLPTNFKSAMFAVEQAAANAMLKQLEADIAEARLAVDGETLDLPVKLKTHDSVFVPLAKWAMLLTGNYRCIGELSMRPIQEAVHSDLDASRQVYEWVAALCERLGAGREDLVPFEKYAIAAQGLLKPSSAARALAAGAKDIERIDLLVKLVAAHHGMHSDSVCDTVRHVNHWLRQNRSATVAAAQTA